MSHLRNIGVLILDFDGVVIESNNVKTEAFQHVFSRFPEYAKEMMEYHYSHISNSRFDKFDFLLSLMGEINNHELKKDISDDFSNFTLERMYHVPLVPGALRFLNMITACIPVYLASVTPIEDLKIILEKRQLGKWFKGIYGCPPWTKPAAIADILSIERIDPDCALLIGDSAGDQLAAATCGIHFLARNSGLNFPTPLPQMFQDLDEITDYFNTMRNE